MISLNSNLRMLPIKCDTHEAENEALYLQNEAFGEPNSNMVKRVGYSDYSYRGPLYSNVSSLGLFILFCRLNYLLHFLRNKFTCYFRLLTGYLHAKSDWCVILIGSFYTAYGKVWRLLLCIGAILIALFSS